MNYNSGRSKPLFTLIKIILTGVIIYFVGRKVGENWDQVREFEWDINVPYFLLSLITAQAGFFIFALCWKVIISGFGHTLSAPKAFRIANLSNLGRYIPGKVWQVFGMLYLAKKEGVSELHAGTSFVIVQMFTIPASLLVYVLTAQFEPAILTDKFAILGQTSVYLIGLLSMAGCLSLIFYPRPFVCAGNYLLKKLGRPPIAYALDKTVALEVYVGYFCGWILSGLAFWLFLRSVLGDSAPSVAASVGLYNAAYQIGYLALFAPGGVGVREAVMSLLLQPFLGPLAVAIAIAARIWAVIIDSLAALVALSIKK